MSTLTGIQLRAARAALGWSAQELAERSSVSQRTIVRFEQFNGVPPGRAASLIVLRKTLEEAGIEFIGTPGDSPGIRVKLVE